MVQPRISVVVLNWNGAGLLEKCLESINAQDYADIELIVIDNASTDGSVETAKRIAKDKFIGNDSNQGFSRAMNKGIEAASGDYILPLNYDIIMEAGFVSAMVETAESGHRIGSVSGKLLRMDGKGRKTKIIDSAGHMMFRNRLAVNRGEEQEDKGQFDREEEVFGACGAAALYKKAMIKDITVAGEFFDEDFFAFWEDIDVDWRARLRGWHCLYTPKAVAYHERGGPKKRRSAEVEYHNYKNRYLMMMKNDTAGNMIRVLPQLLITEILKAGALVLRSPGALRSLGEVWHLQKKMFVKRRAIQEGRLVPQEEIEKWFEKFDYIAWVRKNLWQ